MRLFIVICVFTLYPMVVFADSCKDVLPKDGAVQWSKVYKDEVSSLVVAAQFAQMTYSEIKKHLDRGGGINVLGFGSLDGNSTETEVNKFLEEVNKRDDLEKIREHSLSILSRSGDPVLAKVWISCMESIGGVHAYFDTKLTGDDLEANLVLEYVEGADDPDELDIEGASLATHNQWSNPFWDRKIKKGGRIKGGSRNNPVRRIEFVKRRNKSDAFGAVVSVQKFGDISAYLPGETLPPVCTPGIFSSSEKSYSSDPTGDVVLVGGSIEAGGLDRPRLKINADCSSTIEYVARAAFADQIFPDVGTAPWLKIRLTDESGNPLTGALFVDDPTNEANVGAYTKIEHCGKEQLHKVTFRKVFDAKLAETISGFDVVLSDSSGRASPGACQ